MTYKFANFELDEAEFRLSRDATPVVLEPKALKLLIFLVANPGRLIRKQELLDSVWSDAAVSENALTRSVALLRKALEDDSREPRFIETVPRVGYRFLAAVTVGETPKSEADFTALPGAQLRLSRSFGPGVVTIAGVALAVVVAVAIGWHHLKTAHAAQPIHSLAVLPLENLSGDPSLEYLADGATAELITELASLPNVRVVSRSSAMQEKGKHKPLSQIAAELHVDAVVEGSVAVSGGRVRINAALVDPRDEGQMWSGSMEDDAAHMIALEDRVARQMVSHAKLALPALPANTTARAAISPAAHDAYLRGLYYYDRRDPLKSAAYFQSAIDADPGYSSAYAGLAEALVSNVALHDLVPGEAMRQATASADKAIALDSNNGQAYIARATVEATLSWDWAGAARDLAMGTRLSPGDSVGQMMMALYLCSMGKPQDALVHMRQAHEDDPLSFFMARQYASGLYFARRYDEALQQLQVAREMQGSAPNVIDIWAAWLYEKKGLYDQAVDADLRTQQNPSDHRTAALRVAYQRAGWNGYWRERINNMHPGPADCCAYYSLGVAYARVGETEKAFAALNHAAELHCFWLGLAPVDPMLDVLRDKPGFAHLLHNVNLPAQ